MPTTRRAVLAALALPLAGIRPAVAQGQALPGLTPDCRAGAAPTLAQTEGPYFTPDSPLKRDLAADAPNGRRITLGGYVLGADCRPQPRALVQLWQADETGAYDNRGFRLRGHQFTDDAGLWWFSTIVPALYPGRTRHYHVKVQRPGGRVLTTQLYFPAEPQNRRDRIFDERLLLQVTETPDGPLGRFDFLV